MTDCQVQVIVPAPSHYNTGGGSAMLIFGRRLGATAAEGSDQGVQPERRGEEATLAYVIIVIAKTKYI